MFVWFYPLCSHFSLQHSVFLAIALHSRDVCKSKQFARKWTGTSPVTTKCGIRNVHQFSLMSINFLVWFRASFFCTLRDPSACHFILFRLTWSYLPVPFFMLLYWLYCFSCFLPLAFRCHFKKWIQEQPLSDKMNECKLGDYNNAEFGKNR